MKIFISKEMDDLIYVVDDVMYHFSLSRHTDGLLRVKYLPGHLCMGFDLPLDKYERVTKKQLKEILK